jgi:DNA-binding SARP family transcriptional activator
LVVHISIFGPLRVDRESSELTHQDFGGVKPRELLALLLLSRGHAITKDALAERLWPDRAPKNVGGTLETYVSLLRKKLFADRASARQVLSTSARAYAFDTSQVVLDIDLFDDLIVRAEVPGNNRVAMLSQATSLARGDLLQDLGDPSWVTAERELYRDRATRAHLMLGEEHLAKRSFTAAIAQAEESLRIRPYSEEAVRMIMLANYALGHGDAARLAYQRCRTVLADQLGHDPISETEDLAGALIAGVPAEELLADCRTGTGSSHPVLLQTRTSNDRRDPTRQLPFVGRRDDVERVCDQIKASQSGSFRLVMVAGRRGIGRTALLDHLQATVPGVVGREAFSPLDREYPGLPLARALCNGLSDGAGAVDAGAYASAPLIGDDEDTLTLLRTVLRRHGPMVLLLDDLQWADVGTISALAWLSRREPDLPVTVVVAVRDQRGRPIRRLEVLEPHETVRLAPLDAAAVSGTGIDKQLIDLTGGVPVLLADTVRWLNAGGVGPSPSVKEAVFKSVRGLNGTQRVLLQTMSDLDEPIDPFELTGASPLGRSATLGVLDELTSMGLLVRTGSGFRFQAPIVREVIASTITKRPVHAAQSVPVRPRSTAPGRR